MTIRRYVDLAAINTDYGYFLTAINCAPDGMYETQRKLAEEIGNTVDELLRNMHRIGVAVCPCDGIREIEVLTFDMLRSKNPSDMLDPLVAIGKAMYYNDWSFARAYEEVTGNIHPDNLCFKGPSAGVPA